MELRQLTALELGAAIKRGMVSIPEAAQGGAGCHPGAGWNVQQLYHRDWGAGHGNGPWPCKKGVKDAQSPLYGVPMALKDNICTKGFKTSCASKILGDIPPPL